VKIKKISRLFEFFKALGEFLRFFLIENISPRRKMTGIQPKIQMDLDCLPSVNPALRDIGAKTRKIALKSDRL